MADDKEKPRASDRRYGGEKKEERKPAPEHKPEGGGREKPNEGRHMMAAKHRDEHAEMAKSHEKEHRDMHGQHRDAMRAMHGRHEAAMRAMNDRQNAEMGGEGQPNGEDDQTPPGGGAPSGGGAPEGRRCRRRARSCPS